MPHATSSSVTVTPFVHGPASKANFGATVSGADLNNLDEATFNAIREAVYVHSVIVLKNQQELLPEKQFEFIQRFDPAAPPKHGFGNTKEIKELSGVLGKKPWHAVSEGVQLVGHGYQGEDHYGLKNITIEASGHTDFHKTPLAAEEIQKGQSRFGYFHYDGIIYGAHPSRVTSLRCVRAPQGPDVTVRWDDGTGRTLKVKPGSTAFISSSQLYNLLTDEEKKLADNSYWEAAPHPFAWTNTRKFRSSGLGMAPGGETIPLDKLPPWEANKVFKYPMVWLNPVTGEKMFQILPDVVRKLYMKSSPDAEEKIVDDLDEIDLWLNEILDRIHEPEYIHIPPAEEGDMVVWNNWGTMHSAIEYPDSYGTRSMHQCHIASSTAPVGPMGA